MSIVISMGLKVDTKEIKNFMGQGTEQNHVREADCGYRSEVVLASSTQGPGVRIQCQTHVHPNLKHRKYHPEETEDF